MVLAMFIGFTLERCPSQMVAELPMAGKVCMAPLGIVDTINIEASL